MLIDPEYCLKRGSGYHFKTSFCDKFWLVTLWYEIDNGEIGLRSCVPIDHFKDIIKTPYNIKQAILKYLEDPLTEIEMLRKIYKLVRED